MCSTRNLGPRYDVTKPLVLTRIRRDASAGKCVERMISPPRPHIACIPKVISASAAIANLLHRARMPRIQEHPCDSWLWDVPKNRTSCGRQPRTAWAVADHCIFWFTVRKSERCVWFGKCGQQRLAPSCSQVSWDTRTLHCVVSINMFIQKLSHHAQSFSSSRDHTCPHRLSFALAMILTKNARRLQRTIFCVEWESIHSTRQRILVWESLTLRLLVDRSQWLAQCVLCSRGQINHPTYPTLATHDSHSLRKMMTASCTLIIFAEQHERLQATRHRVTSQHVFHAEAVVKDTHRYPSLLSAAKVRSGLPLQEILTSFSMSW